MPELPEVETMRRGIAQVVGCQIRSARPVACDCKPLLVEPRPATFQKRASGATIREVDRLGKRVVLWLDTGDAIVLEPRMTGLVLLADPPSQEHLRFRFELQGGEVDELLYWDRRGLGSVRLFSEKDFRQHFEDGRLGPDALKITHQVLRQRLSNSRRAIKVALLDQRALAGVGNLYASEILHVAGIHPELPCSQLSVAQWQGVHEAMLEVLHEAIQLEGSTLGDGTYRNALNQEGGYQQHHRVYDRAGEVCPGCGKGKVVRIVQAQRSTFFCPRCQLKGRKRSRRAK